MTKMIIIALLLLASNFAAQAHTNGPHNPDPDTCPDGVFVSSYYHSSHEWDCDTNAPGVQHPNMCYSTGDCETKTSWIWGAIKAVDSGSHWTDQDVQDVMNQRKALENANRNQEAVRHQMAREQYRVNDREGCLRYTASDEDSPVGFVSLTIQNNCRAAFS